MGMLGVGAFLGAFLVKIMVQEAMAVAAEEERIDSLAPFVAQFTDMASLDDHLLGQPYIRRSVVVVDQETGTIDRFFERHLPHELRAPHADHVGTIIFYERVDLEVGSYHNADTNVRSGAAFQVLYDISVVDTSTREIVGRHLIEGPEPTEMTQSAGDVYGPEPRWELLDFIERMPRQPVE